MIPERAGDPFPGRWQAGVRACSPCRDETDQMATAAHRARPEDLTGSRWLMLAADYYARPRCGAWISPRGAGLHGRYLAPVGHGRTQSGHRRRGVRVAD